MNKSINQSSNAVLTRHDHSEPASCPSLATLSHCRNSPGITSSHVEALHRRENGLSSPSLSPLPSPTSTRPPSNLNDQLPLGNPQARDHGSCPPSLHFCLSIHPILAARCQEEEQWGIEAWCSIFSSDQRRSWYSPTYPTPPFPL